jgi:hypothetical protein
LCTLCFIFCCSLSLSQKEKKNPRKQNLKYLLLRTLSV